MNYVISNGIIELTVSRTGAEMQSIVKDCMEYLWNGDAKYWGERSPILFPYVGRFTDGKYTLDGQAYEMDIHGFARKLSYEVVCAEKEKLIFELKSSGRTLGSYPYEFVLRIAYELRGNQIQITYQVENLSERIMYFGIGGHPGFRVPLEENLDFSDYYLEFGGSCRPDRVGHTETCFQSGVNLEYPLQDARRIPIRHEMFDEDAVVLENMADEITLKTDKGKRSVKVSYPYFPYLGLWHAPGTEAPYICIEPWSSLPSRQDIIEEIRYKSDLIRLPKRKAYINQWSITID